MEAKKRGELDFRVSLVSEKIIDRHGISYALCLGIKRCLSGLKIEKNSWIFLDGALKAPEEFSRQKTIIKGDEKIPVISLASIMAKVTRDRIMQKLHKKYPQYGFNAHKGYGTALHVEKIQSFGASKIHRKTFEPVKSIAKTQII